MNALAILAVLAWALVALTQLRASLRLTLLPAAQNPDLPSLSVLIPACNEETTLTAALNSLLQVDYPGLEIVLVNDRSSDATGDIMQSLAGCDERVRVVQVDHLPPGWLGKTPALQVASRVARG